MKRIVGIFTLVLVALVAAALAPACEEYEPPPQPVLAGLTSGVLDDPRAPLVIDFGTPVDPSTLFVKVAFHDQDVEGNLYDEDADPNTELRVLLRRDPLEGDLGARSELELDGSRLRMIPDAALPVGPKLVLVVEGGLRSTATGRVAKNRVRIPFSYAVKCASGTSTFESGTYFVLLEVEKPIQTQIQLLAYIEVDPTTGALHSQFTNADRNPALECPSPCPATDVCRLLPAPECVAPSTRAGTADEWPDFVPNAQPPTGYSFFVQGCAVDDGAATGVLTAPATMVVESPPVTVEGLTMTSSFAPGPDGIVRATGSLTADLVRLGTNALGPGNGSMTAVRIPDDRAPRDVPRPPPRADAGSGGTDAGR
mgnify:CR=1 FL=1